MKDNVKLYRTIMALCMMIVSMAGYAPGAFPALAEAAEAGNSEAMPEAWEATPALATEEYSGIFENPEISRMIDEAAAEAREVGWSELRIPLSAHRIGREFISENALAVGQKLIDRGYQAYITGGAVRDMILNKSVNDFDIATDAPLELWQELFGDDLSLHGVENSELQYGVVKLNGEGIDLAPLSNVISFLIGLPGVPETDPEALTSDSPLYDSYDRDMTINALYYDLNTGDILDYHGGLRDIQDRVLRVIGDPDAQLANRPSQMIRYIRFLSRYEGSAFAPDLASVMEHCLDYVGNLDPNNAQNQLRRLWIGGYAVKCFDNMNNYGLLGYFYTPVAELCADEAYLAEARAALTALDAAYDRGEEITTAMGTAVILLPAVRARLASMSAGDAVESALAEMEPVYGFYGSEREETANRLLELLAAGDAQPSAAGLFDNAEINRLIDENYQKVLENGYAELRIPLSLHGIPEEVFTANSLEVGRKLIENGFEAYVVGGCIRDFIMGTESNDIDITTNATLEQQRAIFGDALETHISGGRVFGGVIFPDELVDLATYQNIPASYYGIAGVPEFDPGKTTSTSLMMDSFQRDLTMNAIYYDLANGDLVDFHGGIHDIREHVLNTMVNGLVSLVDDSRRVLRAIRFKARYGFEFSEGLERGIREYGIEGLSTMRRSDMTSNVSKMMIAGYASRAWRLLADYGLLDAAYPPLIRLVDNADYLDYLDKALAFLDQRREDSGTDASDALALLAFLQPEIDRRAERSGYETALCGVLDEQETAFDLTKIRTQLEEVSLLAHDMELVSSRFLKDAVQSSEYFGDALALLNMKALSDSSLTRQAAFWNETAEQAEENSDERPDAATVPEGVVPVTWEVTPEHPMIDTDEARALYQQIAAGDYPTMEELLANPVVQQLDALSAYYKSIYGNTADIDTPEREALREELKDWFLTLGSARTDSVDENGKHHYVYDGPLNRDYQMILALGLPASGKSTFIADPDSEAMGAFILDVDVIKARIPEYVESHGAASDSIHFEGMGIFDRAISEFLTGDMQGVNIVLPIVGGDFDEMMQQYVLPFEAAGYNVKVKFRPAKENEAAARVVMRELGGGQLITSAVAFNFGEGPENVYNRMKDMINAKGEPYGFVEDEEEALEPAA